MEKLRKEIEKSFPHIEKLFSPETLAGFAAAPPDELWSYNIGMGSAIRLRLLHPEHILYREFSGQGCVDQWEMSMELIRAFHKAITGHPTADARSPAPEAESPVG